MQHTDEIPSAKVRASEQGVAICKDYQKALRILDLENKTVGGAALHESQAQIAMEATHADRRRIAIPGLQKVGGGFI